MHEHNPRALYSSLSFHAKIALTFSFVPALREGFKYRIGFHVGMSQPLLNHAQIDASPQATGGGGNAELVKVPALTLAPFLAGGAGQVAQVW
jgi:hypothetical protein